MASSSVKDIENAPAEGERRAISGYYPQYRISASLILRGLRDGSLQWIRVADPLAGRVDDLQIGSQSRVDAFQVKWSNTGERLTFRDLTNTLGGDPSLISQLADGWKRLHPIYTAHKIVVHLVTNRTPSTSDQIPSEDSGSSRHMAAFLQQVWNPAQKSQDPIWSPPAGWAKAWETIQGASGLSPEEFINFVRDCKLELSFTIRESEAQETKEEEILNRDLEHLTQILFATVASPDKIVELNRQKLLETLGWKARFEFRSRHNFPTQDSLYEPIESTAREINEALDKHQQGYIAVLGSPGSGKSTILTHTLRLCRERIIRYYAYVPDAQDPLPLRGESTTFLHDIVLALEKAGFLVGESPSYFDREQLLSRFHHQLNILSADWKTGGRKTVILIDGLDHVARELKPEHSFLCDLPIPEQIPEGVVIILGSQTDQIEDLPDKVQYEIQQSNRRIEMLTLSRGAVFRILDKVDTSRALDTEQKNLIYELSGGHPLALRLLINQIHDATGPAITSILQSTDPFKGDIEAQYHSYWRQIEKDNDIVHLMGLLARLRRAIDWSWIESWTNPVLVNRLRRQFAHYFRIESESRCYFYNNSFRLFVIARTREISPGKGDPSRDRSFHLELANICRNTSVKMWTWEEIFHRVSAEEHDAILEIATQERFRDQVFAFRPADAVEADIRLSLRSASAMQDPVAIGRLSLAIAELRQRTNYLREIEVIDLLLSLGDTSTAIEYLRDGNRLRIGPAAALSIVRKLVELGLQEESQKIFEVAEPLELLAAAAPLENDPQDEKGNLLEAWVRAAVNFRERTQIVETIRRITRAAEPYQKIDADTLTRQFQNRMLYHLGLSFLNEQRWDDLTKIVSEFDLKRREDGGWWFWLLTHSMRERIAAGDLGAAKDFLRQLRKGAAEKKFGSEEMVILAQGTYRLLGEQAEAREQLRLVEQPKIRTDSLNTDSKLDPFVLRFRLNRLLFALGEERDPQDIIPDSPDPREAGIVYFERTICVMARIWADAWRGRRMDGPTVARTVFPLLHFFNRNWRQTDGWNNWYVLQGARTEFYNLLVQAVAEHGKKAIDALAEAFEEQWDDVEKRKYWPAAVCRNVTLFLMRAGKEQSWAVLRLAQIENNMLEGQDVSSRVEECQKQAEAWHQIDEDARTRKSLDQGIRLSFGVGFRKDYQLNDWLNWLILINKTEPERAKDRILWLARAIVALKEATEGPAAGSAAIELLKATFQWSPRRAIKLFNFFLEQRLVSFGDAVGGMLTQAVRDRSDSELLFYATSELAVPLFGEADEELATGLIEYLLTKRTSDSFDAVRHLLSRIRISALPSSRKTWCRGIGKAVKASGRDLSSVGLSDDALLSNKDEMSSKFLRLKDGTTLSLSAAVDQTRSAEKLFQILERESDGSYFKWEFILTDTTLELDAPTINRLAEILEKKHYAAQSLAVLSERLAALGMKEKAWELGLRALNNSKEYGWSRGFDGGSRLAAFRALVSADKQNGRRLMYEVLARDGGGSAGNLDEIIPLLVDEIPLPQIWAEIEDYLQELLGGLTLSPAKPQDWDSIPSDDIASRAVADLIATYINHPATPVAVCAQRTCIELLSRNNPHITKSFIELLTVDESYQENILLILEAVGLRAPSVAQQFLTQIQHLAQSPNYAVRVAVRRIFGQVKQALDLPPQQTYGLPEIYRLSLPPLSDDIDEDRIRAEAPLPDSNNPAEIMGPFYSEIAIISEMTSLPKTNLFHRGVQIMREIAPEEIWSASGELRLRSILDSAGLKFSFRRPRAVLARRAMFHIIAELLDAGAFKRIDPSILDYIVQFADPNMLLYRPMARPEDVIPIIRKERYSERNEEWIERLDDSLYALKGETSDGRIILAEESVLKILDWELPTEIRESLVAIDSTPKEISSEEEDSLFEKVQPHLISDYVRLDFKERPSPIIIKNNAFRYDTPGSQWLALNPAIAKSFGWSLSEDGFVRWTNQAGDTMVETIWWEGGPAFFSPPHLNVEVGRGWLVLASLTAFTKIKERYPNLARLLRLKRRFNRDKQKVPVNRSRSIKIKLT